VNLLPENDFSNPIQLYTVKYMFEYLQPCSKSKFPISP
jgi:hypothetical protein